MAKKKYIWEGSVGVAIEPMKKKDGSHFWKYEFTRFVKKEDESSDYYRNFSGRNDEALDIVVAKGKAFRAENSADEWVKLQERTESRGVFESPESTESQPNQPAA